VEESWDRRMHGPPTFQLSKKLTGLKQDLRRWNKESVRNIFAEGKGLETNIAELQAMKEERGLTPELQEVVQSNVARYHNILHQQEIFRRQKSRVSWLNAGDSNTWYFYRSMVVRRAHNLITELHNEGVVVRGREAISELVLDYFKDRWGMNQMEFGWGSFLSYRADI